MGGGVGAGELVVGGGAEGGPARGSRGAWLVPLAGIFVGVLAVGVGVGLLDTGVLVVGAPVVMRTSLRPGW
jgi:hypothetical protein